MRHFPPAIAAMAIAVFCVPALAAGEAVFQGELTCRFQSAMVPFSSRVVATIVNRTIQLRADDKGWSVELRPDFSNRTTPGSITFAQSILYGPVEGFFGGATAQIRVSATSDAALRVTSEGGMSICEGALALKSGRLPDALAR